VSLAYTNSITKFINHQVKMTSKETTKKPKSKKQLRHEAQEKIALEIRAKATTHMKKHNVTSQAEIIAPVIKQKANERDNTLMLVRKRKAMQLQKQQEQQRMQSNAKKQKVPPIEECTSSIEAAAAALLPKGPTWHEASIDDVPELIKGAARVGYGVPVTTKLPAGTVLPKGWIIVEESKTKRQYFWNKNTNRVCWGDPRNVPSSSSTSSFPPAPLQEVEPFHIAIEHGQHRSYYWEAKSGKTNFDSSILTEDTKPPPDEDAPEVGAPEGFMDANGDIPRWQYLRDKAIKQRVDMAAAIEKAELEQKKTRAEARAQEDEEE